MSRLVHEWQVRLHAPLSPEGVCCGSGSSSLGKAKKGGAGGRGTWGTWKEWPEEEAAAVAAETEDTEQEVPAMDTELPPPQQVRALKTAAYELYDGESRR
jgi:hypothetical protein